MCMCVCVCELVKMWPSITWKHELLSLKYIYYSLDTTLCVFNFRISILYVSTCMLCFLPLILNMFLSFVFHVLSTYIMQYMHLKICKIKEKKKSPLHSPKTWYVCVQEYKIRNSVSATTFICKLTFVFCTSKHLVRQLCTT